MRFMVPVQNFILGLHTETAPDMLPDGASPLTTDLTFDRNTLKVRPGTLNHGLGPGGGTLRTGTRALMQFVPRNGGTVRLVGVNDERVQASSEADQTFDTNIAFTGFDVSTTKQPRLVQFNDYLYVVDGENPVRKCFLSALADDYYWSYTRFTPGAECPNPAVLGRVAISADDHLFVCRDNGGGTGYGLEYSDATPPVHVRTYGPGTYGVMDIAVDATYVYLMDANGSGLAPNHHVYMYQRSDGAFVRSFGLHGAAGAGDTIATSQAIDVDAANNRLYIIADTRVKRYNITTGAFVDDWLTMNAATCPPDYGTVGSAQDLCLSAGYVYLLDAFAAGGSEYFYAVQMFDKTPTFVKRFGGEYIDYGQVAQLCIGGSEGHLFSLNRYSASEFTAGGTYLRHVGIQNGDTNGALLNAQGLGVRSDGELAFADRQSASKWLKLYSKTTLPASNFLALADLAQPGPPTVATPAGAAGTGWVPEGDYELCYSIDRWTGREWAIGRASEVAQAYVPATTVSALTVTATPGALDGPHRLTLWLKPPLTSDFWAVRWIYVDDLLAGTAVTWYTDGQVNDELADLLEQYIHVPPAGASLAMEWKGRMLYVGPYPGSSNTAKDTVYLSAWGNADQCPQIHKADADDNYGSYLQIDTDGREITGLGKLGSYPVILKEEAVYLLDGETWLDFRWSQVGLGHGCLRHETVAQVGGMVCVWLSADGLWGYNGQEVFEFGKPVNKLIRENHARAQLALSYGVYDPLTLTYRLTVPASTAAAVYATGTSYVYYVRTQEWRVFTHQPDGALCFAGKAATPGIYAGERYDHAVTGSCLYRLGAGTVDKDHADASQSIAWTWWDKVRHEPPDQYKDVLQAYARIVEGAAANHAITAHLRINGDSSDAASAALTFPASRGVPYTLEWTPDTIADVESYQFGLTGVSSGALEINRIDLLAATRGKIE
ncbi:MAG: NHL repeat-containing protein [Armatimonadota bacterium]